MSDLESSTASRGQADREDIMSALFAQMVMQQANMAMMLLGKVPHPESGQTIKDIEAAQLFIDQLEMLERKTKGNLTKEESSLLKQSLMSLRLAFVEAVEPSQQQPPSPTTPTPSPAQPKESAAPPSTPSAPTETEDEHRKKFTKKY